MRHRGGGGGRHRYWGKPLSVILSDSIIWWQCMEKRWQCIKETTPCLSRMRSSGGASGHRKWGIC